MKKTVCLFIIFALLLPFATSAEKAPLHILWDMDFRDMDIWQVQSFLENKKGIISDVVKNYDSEGRNALNSSKKQNLTLYKLPCTINYTEYKTFSRLALQFKGITDESNVDMLIQKFVGKYGDPTCVYYDLYSRSAFDWKMYIGGPMYHERAIVHDWKTFSLHDTVESWEHFKPSEDDEPEMNYIFWIDNIEISVDFSYPSYYYVCISFYSRFPSGEVIEVSEHKNIANYEDTGL